MEPLCSNLCMVNIMEKMEEVPIPYSWVCLWTEMVKDKHLITDVEYTGFKQVTIKKYNEYSNKLSK